MDKMNDRIMPPFRIGLSGKMRSGKDTVGKALVKAYGFERWAFADHLKELAAELFEVKPGAKNRRLLVSLGRHLCEIDRNVWVRYVLNNMPADRSVVITDLRFPYEAEALRDAGFYLARIEAPPSARLNRLLNSEGTEGAKNTTELLEDPSETALDGWTDWDFVLNGTDYAPLYADVERMMKEVEGNA